MFPWSRVLLFILLMAGVGYATEPAEPGPDVSGPGPSILLPETPGDIGPETGATTRVAFLGPEGMWLRIEAVRDTFAGKSLVAPARYNLPRSETYRLTLSELPGRPGVELRPSIEVTPATPRTEAYLAHNPIPVQFTEEDFDQVQTGNRVTKAVYLPDPEFMELALAAAETLVSTRLDPGVDAIVEAERRGTILAIVRLDDKSPVSPDAEDLLAGDVLEALDQQDAWLGKSTAGNRWREYLKNAQLREQLSSPQQADPEVVAAVLAKYTGDASGLDNPHFRKVATRLEDWLTDLRIPAKDKLPEIVRASKGKYVSHTAANLSQARTQLDQALTRLNAFLGRGAAGNGWRKYLRLADLRQELAKHSDQIEDSTLVTIAGKFDASQPGLQLPQFQKVRDALVGYLAARQIAADEDKTRGDYDKVLELLAEALEQYAQDPKPETFARLGAAAGWLEHYDQNPAIVAAIRKHYSRRNLYASLSKDVVAAGIRRPIDEQTDIRQVILGTDITGQGTTRGQVDVELIPSRTAALLRIVLSGKTNADNVGYNGPVTIYSDSTTEFSANKDIVVDDRGLHDSPAVAHATTKSRVNDIGGGALARRIAWNRSSQSLGQAEAIGSRNAERRIEGRLNSETATLLAKANKAFQEKFRRTMEKEKAFPRLLRFSNTGDRLHVLAEQAAGDQMAAPTAPPEIGGEHAMAVRVHESLLNNAATSLLGGKTVKEEDLQKDAENMPPKLRERLKSNQDEDPWSITFARNDPVTVTFADGGFSVTVRGRRYTSGERTFGAMNVTGVYKVEKTDSGMRAVRQGPIQIEPPGFVSGKDRLTPGQIALRNILERRFGTLMEPEFKFQGFELPGAWKAAGKFRLDHFASTDGWLALGWQRDDDAASHVAEQAATEAASR